MSIIARIKMKKNMKKLEKTTAQIEIVLKEMPDQSEQLANRCSELEEKIAEDFNRGDESQAQLDCLEWQRCQKRHRFCEAVIAWAHNVRSDFANDLSMAQDNLRLSVNDPALDRMIRDHIKNAKEMLKKITFDGSGLIDFTKFEGVTEEQADNEQNYLSDRLKETRIQTVANPEPAPADDNNTTPPDTDN